MAFWFPVKSLHLRSMLSKSIRCPQNFNACGRHLSTKWAQFFSKITLNHMSHIPCYKTWMFGLQRFAHLPYSSDHSPTNDQFCKHLDNIFQGKCFHKQQQADNAFKEFVESWSMIFILQEETNLFLIGKNVLIVRVPILINKDLFELSYNDLKCMVWNHNYICSNLILWPFCCQGTWISKQVIIWPISKTRAKILILSLLMWCCS